MAGVVVLAGFLGLAFNWLMPQGIAFLPPEVAKPLWTTATPLQGRKLMAQGAALVDANNAGDYKKAHVKGAVNLYPKDFKLLFPLLKPQLATAPAVLVYGRSLSRYPAASIAQLLKENGLPRVLVLPADLKELAQAGYPMRQRRRTK